MLRDARKAGEGEKSNAALLYTPPAISEIQIICGMQMRWFVISFAAQGWSSSSTRSKAVCSIQRLQFGTKFGQRLESEFRVPSRVRHCLPRVGRPVGIRFQTGSAIEGGRFCRSFSDRLRFAVWLRWSPLLEGRERQVGKVPRIFGIGSSAVKSPRISAFGYYGMASWKDRFSHCRLCQRDVLHCRKDYKVGTFKMGTLECRFS